MKFLPVVTAGLVILTSVHHLGMARQGVYDEVAREQEKIAREQEKALNEAEKGTNPAKRFASGVKNVTVDSATGLISETAEETSDSPITGPLEGVRKGSEQVLDKTVKGAYKVATLGFGELEHYEVEDPAAGSGEPAKIKIKIPGT